jgi:hypothetical protein
MCVACSFLFYIEGENGMFLELKPEPKGNRFYLHVPLSANNKNLIVEGPSGGKIEYKCAKSCNCPKKCTEIVMSFERKQLMDMLEMI